MMLKYVINRRSDDDTIAMIQAMRKQETTYTTRKYNLKSNNDANHRNDDNDSKNEPVDAECRTKMAEWCFHIAKHCEFQPETASMAISLADRYVISEHGECALKNRKLFKLVVMTCFYTAIKVHEPEALTPDLMHSLSRKEFKAKQFEKCEIRVLKAIQWKVNPPTSYSFARLYSDCIPKTLLKAEERQAVMKTVYKQLEKATKDYSFIAVRPSTLAFAALSNSLSGYLKDIVMTALADVCDIDTKESRVVEAKLQRRLNGKPADRNVFRLLSSSKFVQSSSKTLVPSSSKRSSREENKSPRTVTAAC